MNIRRATLNDLEAITALNIQLFALERQFTDSYSLVWTTSSAGQEYFTKRITQISGVAFVAVDNNQIIGYICGYTFQHPTRAKGSMAEIENMYVKEEHQRQGIGKQLIQAFLAEVKNRSVWRVKVGALHANTNAHAFYKAIGFLPHEIVFECQLS